MYDYLSEVNEGTVVGSFTTDRNSDFKLNTANTLETFKENYSVDPIRDLGSILSVGSMKESYKDQLIGDVMESAQDDEYLAMHPQKLEQLFENTSLELIRESGLGPLNPIVGLSLPVLKKNYLENHSKDIMMTEVPTKPIVKIAFERKFLKNKKGDKFYIPEIFYDGKYKEVDGYTRGKAINPAWFPQEVGEVLPVLDLDILGLSGGSLEQRDELSLDFHIEALRVKLSDGTNKDIEGLNIQPDFAAAGSFSYRVDIEDKDGSRLTDLVTGQVSSYDGKITVSAAGGKVTHVKFGGHLSNQNNTETVELDRERETKEWKIPDGQRINTGLTLEKIKDYQALFDLNITSEIISDMSQVLTQFEDSQSISFLQESLEKWRHKKDLPYGYEGGFVETTNFSATPTSNVYVPVSQWVGSELKYYMNRQFDHLKEKLKTTDLMFVVFGNPANITLIQDDVRWVIDEDTKVGGIQLEYKFGVLTTNKNRVHVVSSMKVPRSAGIRIVAYPLSKDTYTFKHYKYSLNIENSYRNPYTPLTPNIMGTSRYLTTELLPVQGEFLISNNDFGRVQN